MKRILVVSLALVVSGLLGCALLGRCSAPPPMVVSYCDTSAIEQRLEHAEQQIRDLTEQAKQDRSLEGNRFEAVANELGVTIPTQ